MNTCRDDAPDGQPFKERTHGIHLTLVYGDASVLDKRFLIVPEARRAIPVGIIGHICFDQNPSSFVP